MSNYYLVNEYKKFGIHFLQYKPSDGTPIYKYEAYLPNSTPGFSAEAGTEIDAVKKLKWCVEHNLKLAKENEEAYDKYMQNIENKN